MSEARKKGDWLVVAALVLAVVLVRLGLYVGGYFALSTRLGPVRVFQNRQLMEIYSPLTRVEKFITRKPVIPGHYDPPEHGPT